MSRPSLACPMQVSRTMKPHLIRQRLLRRRRQLLARYHDELARADEVNIPESETIDRASDQWEARLLSRLGEVDARAVEAVTEALRRLDRGDYGACAYCDARIGQARLDVLPEAATCIECAETAERAA